MNIDTVVSVSDLSDSMSGIELLQKIRQDEDLKSTPFILITGSASLQIITGVAHEVNL